MSGFEPWQSQDVQPTKQPSQNSLPLPKNGNLDRCLGCFQTFRGPSHKCRQKKRKRVPSSNLDSQDIASSPVKKRREPSKADLTYETIRTMTVGDIQFKILTANQHGFSRQFVRMTNARHPCGPPSQLWVQQPFCVRIDTF